MDGDFAELDRKACDVYDLAVALLDGSIPRPRNRSGFPNCSTMTRRRANFMSDSMYESAKFHRWSVKTTSASESGDDGPFERPDVPYASPDNSPCAAFGVHGPGRGHEPIIRLRCFRLLHRRCDPGRRIARGRDVDVARDGGTSAIVHREPPRANPVQIGVISGAAHCCWADASTAIEPGACVSVGRRFVLGSGLLQIWYNSGVEVILQGPAIYEVDSRYGGFLSLGQLTARVEKTCQRDGQGDRLVPAPEFTIRTPTAVLANRAVMPGPGLRGSSEFGVVVDSPDVTRVHVFRGAVLSRMTLGNHRDEVGSMLLTANRSLMLHRPVASNKRQDARMNDVQFARRTLVLPDGNPDKFAWLKAIGTGTQAEFVAVGNGEDVELPPIADLPGVAASPCRRRLPRLLLRPTPRRA